MIYKLLKRVQNNNKHNFDVLCVHWLQRYNGSNCATPLIISYHTKVIETINNTKKNL
jgi:hypothetical protein